MEVRIYVGGQRCSKHCRGTINPNELSSDYCSFDRSRLLCRETPVFLRKSKSWKGNMMGVIIFP